MKQEDLTTKQIIIRAAEQVFMNKGYAAAKTTEIARVAGVNHAMLHYYFRTKENLFNMVFEQKAGLFGSSLSTVFDRPLSFRNKIRLAMETHFDILVANPRLPLFIFSEIMGSEEKREMAKRIILPKATDVLQKLTKGIRKEVAKGNIYPIEPLDLILNMVSVNIFTFIAFEALSDAIKRPDHEMAKRLQLRKESNVQFILRSLKPDK